MRARFNVQLFQILIIGTTTFVLWWNKKWLVAHVLFIPVVGGISSFFADVFIGISALFTVSLVLITVWEFIDTVHVSFLSKKSSR